MDVLSLPLPYDMWLNKSLSISIARHIVATQSMCLGWQGVPTCAPGWGHTPPPLGGSSRGLPSQVECLSPQGVLLWQSTLRPLHPCGLSCGVPLVGSG